MRFRFGSQSPETRGSVRAWTDGAYRRIRETAVELVIERCSSCHAREPLWEGLAFAPKGIHLETEEEVLKMANEIYWQSAASWAMPPGNIIWLEDEERVLLSDWHASLKKN